ncbi:MAG: formylglycine-generating enzyme family protein [Planctomycetaceae bacterium]|nr:formylglycine-generating enzyme family protein [Planctomycetaceae bacterium]
MNDEQLVAKCFDIDHKYSPTSKHPANGLIWYVAARFCNWMSAQEGLDESQWCYGPNELIGPGMKLSPDCLSRFGYRMPTEAEWEYAARSGTLNSRYFGDAMEFSNQFALFNSGLGDTPIALMESGVLKPNDFGLFDVLGNCDEWTQSHFYSWRDFAESDHFEDTVGLESVGGDDDQRVARGGSLVARPVYTRASNRYPIHPNISSSQNRNCIGLRLARTLPPRN